MPGLILSGFEPFGDHPSNPSAELVDGFHSPAGFAHWTIHRVQLPVVWGKAWKKLHQAILETSADAVLALGLAAESKVLRLEHVALNWRNAESTDNEGQGPAGRYCVIEGPPAYWSQLPLHSFAEALSSAGIAFSHSAHAGTYLCNETFYRLMHYAATDAPGLKAGFIHIPLPQYQDQKTLNRALTAFLGCLDGACS